MDYYVHYKSGMTKKYTDVAEIMYEKDMIVVYGKKVGIVAMINVSEIISIEVEQEGEKDGK